MKEFDLEEISQFDGKDGRPVYIVHQEKVYDVTNSKLWKGGLHMRRHQAGKDLSVDIGAAPHTPEVLERYPLIGILRKRDAQERAMPELLSRLLERYPMLRRHPHPMTVHFPIAFMMSTTFFTLLYLLTGVKSLEITGLHCLAAGILFIPIVIVTGLFSWWLNYLARPLTPITVKIGVSLVLFVDSIIVFAWRMAVPDILNTFSAGSLVYIVLILSFVPLVSVMGWFGAKLTFPVEKD